MAETRSEMGSMLQADVFQETFYLRWGRHSKSTFTGEEGHKVVNCMHNSEFSCEECSLSLEFEIISKLPVAYAYNNLWTLSGQ